MTPFVTDHEFDPGNDSENESYCWAHISEYGNGDCKRPKSEHQTWKALYWEAVEALDEMKERWISEQNERQRVQIEWGKSVEAYREAVEALEKLTVDTPLQGRAFKGNAELPGCEDFYRGYNSGIDVQFNYAKKIAEAVLAKARAALGANRGLTGGLLDLLKSEGVRTCLCFVCSHQASYGPCAKCGCTNTDREKEQPKPEPPETMCPKCGEWVVDYDGFGVLRHAACGYCQHPSIDGGVCGLCGAHRDAREEPRPE